MNGSPYVREGGSNYLLDTGSAVSVVRASGPTGKASELACARLGAMERAARVALPPEVAGIMGWDFVTASAKEFVHVDCNAGLLWIDETPPGGFGEFQSCAFRHAQIAGGSLPIADAALYGLSSVEGATAVLDTGSPVSIASKSFAAGAALFEEIEGSETPPLVTTGADGKATQLEARIAAGLRLGTGADFMQQRIFVGDLPMAAACGVEPSQSFLLVGMDVLGKVITFDLRTRTLHLFAK